MPTVVPVKFTHVVRELWFDPANTGAQEADHVLCQTERGLELGLAVGDAFEVSDQELEERLGNAELKPVARIATEDDLAYADVLAERGEAAMPIFREHVAASGLDIKPVAVEYLFDAERAVCYFSAEERVDFRQLVRDLSRALHARIDMRQIGVREEAAIVGGYGHCGQELCCRRFNTAFDPVSIRMAKEQDLPLNSTKISGACGRLMCCLRYEFEAYRDFKNRAPKRNAVIDTPLGMAKIVEYNTPKEQITLRLENGRQVRIPLADMEASECAKRKSEELGCACRPDTVSRSVLERLESPEVQAALAELDRKNGLVEPEETDDPDLFVAPAKRRRRHGEIDEKSAPRHAARRRTSGSKNQSEDAECEVVAPRRARRRRTPGATDVAGGTEAAEQRKSNRPVSRRRHHASRDAEQGSEERSAGRSAVRRTRRPGDRGGMADGGSEEASSRSGARPKHARRFERGNRAERTERAERTHKTDASEGAGAPRRRRRFTRSRSGGTNDPAAGAPSAD